MIAVASAATLEELQSSFMSRYDEVNTKRDEQLKKLEASYLGALERHLAKVTGSGKLDEVLPVRNEIEAVRTDGDSLPELAKSADRELKATRGKFVGARGQIIETHAKSLIELSDKMISALEVQERELTQAGKLDEAIAARRMRETLASDKGIQASRERLAIEKGNGQLLGEWENLLENSFVVVKKGGYDPHVYGADLTGLKAFVPLITWVEKEGVEKGEAFLCVAPTTVEFNFKEPVQQFRAEARPVGGGKLAMRVRVGAKIFYEHVAGREAASINLKFEPTRKITLEVDPLGDLTHDWGYWFSPEVR